MTNKERLEVYNWQLGENGDVLDLILKGINDLPEPEDLTEELSTYTTEVEEQEVTLSDIAEAIKNKVAYAEDLSEELTTQNEKLTTQESTVDDIIRVLNEKVLFGGEEMVKYSIDEREIGTWIDGRPIYRRVFEVSVSDTSEQRFISNEAFNSIDLVVEAKLYRISSSSSVNNAYLPVEVNKIKSAATQIAIYPTKTSFSNCTHLVLEYTKTTD